MLQLSYPISPYPTLPYPIPSHPIPSHPIRSDPVLSHHIFESMLPASAHSLLEVFNAEPVSSAARQQFRLNQTCTANYVCAPAYYVCAVCWMYVRQQIMYAWSLFARIPFGPLGMYVQRAWHYHREHYHREPYHRECSGYIYIYIYIDTICKAI